MLHVRVIITINTTNCVHFSMGSYEPVALTVFFHHTLCSKSFPDYASDFFFFLISNPAKQCGSLLLHCARVPVLHEIVHPDQSSNEENSSHIKIKARQRDFRCREEAMGILLPHFNLWCTQHGKQTHARECAFYKLKNTQLTANE